MKAYRKFADCVLVRQSRLSVMPVAKSDCDRICRMGGWQG
jgi:predicted RNA-binding protein with PUA-like domain